MQQTSTTEKKRFGFILNCSGIGDCLYAIPFIKRCFLRYGDTTVYDIFTHHPQLFLACPYLERVYLRTDTQTLEDYANVHRTKELFKFEDIQHSEVDTMDFISLPAEGIQLSFREKTLEYFPQETDTALQFDVVLNTSQTWPSRSWPLENWQRLADELMALGKTVAVVGKDVGADGARKRSPPLSGCHNLVNTLSLDQTYFTIRKAGLFVTCQNGLSVLSGTTETETIVLDMSIEWSKRAIYRHENPFYKVEYVKGQCSIYCCAVNTCPRPENNGVFKCIPDYATVRTAVLKKLTQNLPKKQKWFGLANWSK